jgi:hypothetical protein
MIVAFTDYYENPADKAHEISAAEAFAASIYDSVVVPSATTAMPAPAPAPVVVAATAPHVDVPSPIAAIVQGAEAIAPVLMPVIGAAIPGAAPAIAAVTALAGAAGVGVTAVVPTSLVLDQNMVNLVVQAEPLIAMLLGALVKAAIAGSTQLKAS